MNWAEKVRHTSPIVDCATYLESPGSQQGRTGGAVTFSCTF